MPKVGADLTSYPIATRGVGHNIATRQREVRTHFAHRERRARIPHYTLNYNCWHAPAVQTRLDHRRLPVSGSHHFGGISVRLVDYSLMQFQQMSFVLQWRVSNLDPYSRAVTWHC